MVLKRNRGIFGGQRYAFFQGAPRVTTPCVVPIDGCADATGFGQDGALSGAGRRALNHVAGVRTRDGQQSSRDLEGAVVVHTHFRLR